MRIFLIGFMGTGKSTVGALLAERMNVPLFELDDVIVKNSGFPNVREIFAARGEPFFRSLETAALRELVASESGIVSTGGGIVMADENRRLLSGAHSHIVFLRTEFATL